MKKAINFCLDENILVFDGKAEEYDSLTKRLFYLARQEYRKWFDREPVFHFEQGISRKRLKELEVDDYNTLEDDVIEYFFNKDEYCQKRDEHIFVLADDNSDGIVGCYT